MAEIVEYRILENNAVYHLEREVNRAISSGVRWQPLGGLTVLPAGKYNVSMEIRGHDNIKFDDFLIMGFAQAMVLYGD